MASKMNYRWFSFGVLMFLIAIGFGIWGFKLGKLTDDQRKILVFILPLASGFACGAFKGAINVQTSGWKDQLAVAATGGFAVWLVTTIVLFPTVNTITTITVYLRGTNNRVIHNIKGSLTLYPDNTAAISSPVGVDGKVVFQNVHKDLMGEKARIQLQSAGYVEVTTSVILHEAVDCTVRVTKDEPVAEGVKAKNVTIIENNKGPIDIH